MPDLCNPLSSARSNQSTRTRVRRHIQNILRSWGLPVSYLPPFAFVKQKYKITANADRDRVTLMHRDLLDIVKLLLRGVTVDEPWYLAQYPDVSEAIHAGMFKSAKHHFVENGYFE